MSEGITECPACGYEALVNSEAWRQERDALRKLVREMKLIMEARFGFYSSHECDCEHCQWTRDAITKAEAMLKGGE